MKIKNIWLYLLLSLVLNSVFAEPEFKQKDVSSDLNLNIFLQQRCMFGDFDAVRYDLNYSKDLKIYLSLLNLETNQEVSYEIFKGFYNYKSKQEMSDYVEALIAKGENLAVSFKDLKPGPYLIKICGDSSGKATCTGKKLQDIATVLKAYKDPKSDFVPEDHVYYYQPVVLKDGKLSYLTTNLLKVNSKKFDQTFKKLGINNSKEHKNISKETVLIGSLALEEVDNSLRVNLPLYAKAKCGQ